jgi:hypothetical protein
MDQAGATMHCADCGASGDDAGITLHQGAVSAPSDEGHVRFTQIALCARCTARRLAVQEPLFV